MYENVFAMLVCFVIWGIGITMALFLMGATYAGLKTWANGRDKKYFKRVLGDFLGW